MTTTATTAPETTTTAVANSLPRPANHDSVAAALKFTPSTGQVKKTVVQKTDEEVMDAPLSELQTWVKDRSIDQIRFDAELERRAKRDTLLRVMPENMDGYTMHQAMLKSNVADFKDMLQKVAAAWHINTDYDSEDIRKSLEFEINVEHEKLRGIYVEQEEHNNRVRSEKARILAQDEAKRLIRREEAPAPLPEPETWGDMLEEGAPPIDWEIEGMFEHESAMVLYAPGKTGKTTLLYNMIRSFLQDEPFIGRLAVTPRHRKILYIQPEMSRTKTLRQLAVSGIEATDNLVVWCTAGANANFDLKDVDVLNGLIAQWKDEGITDVILDGLRPMMDAVGMEENTEAGVFLDRLNVFKSGIGAANIVIVHHAGKDGTARGSSKILDWGDVNLKMSVDPEDDSIRLLEVAGRDVDFETYSLTFMPETKRYVADQLASGEHLEAISDFIENQKTCSIVTDVIRTIAKAKGKPATRNSIYDLQKEQNRGLTKAQVYEALEILDKDGKLDVEEAGTRTYYSIPTATEYLTEAEDEPDVAATFDGYADLSEEAQTQLRDATALFISGESGSVSRAAARVAGDDEDLKEAVVDFLAEVKRQTK